MFEEETSLSLAEIAASLEDDLKTNQQERLLYHSYLLLQRGHQLQSVSELARENPFLIALNLADVVLNNSRFISLPESIQLKIQQAFTLYLELAITQFQNSPKIIYTTLLDEFKENLKQLTMARQFGDVRLEFEHELTKELLNLFNTNEESELSGLVKTIIKAARGEFKQVFDDLRKLVNKLSHLWYAEVYFIRKLASLIIAYKDEKDEKTAFDLLIELQTLLSKTATSDWHIAYAAIEALSSIVKYSKFPRVQQRAWCGEPCSTNETGYFHLLSYQDFHVKQGSETSWRVRYIAGCAYAQLCEHETPAIKEEAHNALNALLKVETSKADQAWFTNLRSSKHQAVLNAYEALMTRPNLRDNWRCWQARFKPGARERSDQSVEVLQLLRTQQQYAEKQQQYYEKLTQSLMAEQQAQSQQLSEEITQNQKTQSQQLLGYQKTQSQQHLRLHEEASQHHLAAVSQLQAMQQTLSQLRETVSGLSRAQRDEFMSAAESYILGSLQSVIKLYNKTDPSEDLQVNDVESKNIIFCYICYLIKSNKQITDYWHAYLALPFVLRQYFYQILKQIANKPESSPANFNQIMALLDNVAQSSEGTSPAMAFRRTQWQRLLTESLTSTTPTAIRVSYLAGTKKQTVYLHPEVLEQLIDSNTGFFNETNKTPHGKSLVIPLKIQGEIVAYAKIYPERPGRQLAVDRLSERISGFGLQSTLCAVEITTGRYQGRYPVLFSQAIPGQSLQSCLDEGGQPAIDAVERGFDPYSFSLGLLTRLLIVPHDDKLDNLIAVPMHSEDEASTPQYRLVGFDHDDALEMGLAVDEQREQLRLISFFFCSVQAKKPLDEHAVTEFLKLDPLRCTAAWLQHLQANDDVIQMGEQGLFTQKE